MSKTNEETTAEQGLSAAFERAAGWLSQQYTIDYDDLTNAYQSEPKSLTTHYEAASSAKSERNSWIGWSVFWGVVMWPVAGYTGYRAYDENETVKSIGVLLNSKVNRQEAPKPVNKLDIM